MKSDKKRIHITAYRVTLQFIAYEESIKININNRLLTHDKIFRQMYHTVEIITGGSSNSIYIWKYNIFLNEFILLLKKQKNIHSSYVSCLVRMNEKMFISGSHDKSMKVWMSSSNDGEYKCIQTITKHNNNGHSSDEYCLVRMNEKMFISGSYDYSIKVWMSSSNDGEYKCLSTALNDYVVFSIT